MRVLPQLRKDQEMFQRVAGPCLTTSKAAKLATELGLGLAQVLDISYQEVALQRQEVRGAPPGYLPERQAKSPHSRLQAKQELARVFIGRVTVHYPACVGRPNPDAGQLLIPLMTCPRPGWLVIRLQAVSAALPIDESAAVDPARSSAYCNQCVCVGHPWYRMSVVEGVWDPYRLFYALA